MIGVIIVCIAIFAFFLFDKFQINEDIKASGGIKNKYNTLVSWIASSPNPIIEERKDRLSIRVNTPNIRTFFEIIPTLNGALVTVDMDYGIRGKITNKWNFDNSKYTQQDMINAIATYMASAQERLLQAKSIDQSIHHPNKTKAIQRKDLNRIPEGFGKFGFDSTNPIPTHGVMGNLTYLNRLRTADNKKIHFERIGSTFEDNIQSPIDIYEIYDSDLKIAKIYLSPYHEKTSCDAPQGFKLS